jgi:hypothetical protein
MSAGSVGLHFLNIALHAANTILTYIVARRLGLLRIAAVAVFMIVPTSVEAVSWMVALPDVLSATLSVAFGLAAGQRPSSGCSAAASKLRVITECAGRELLA